MRKDDKRKSNKSHIDIWQEVNNPETMLRISGILKDGGTLKDVADFVGVNCNTIHAWKSKYPEFAKLIAENKDVVDRKVENALLSRALGFKNEERKKIIRNGTLVQEEIITRNVIPDVTACVIWLNNRKSEQWKRNRDLYSEENTRDVIQINVVKAKSEREEINKEAAGLKKSKRYREKMDG